MCPPLPPSLPPPLPRPLARQRDSVRETSVLKRPPHLERAETSKGGRV